MYNVEEVSKIVGVSKVTIYKKIKKLKDLQEYIVNNGDRVYILKDGIDVLKENLEKNNIKYVKEEISIDLDISKDLINILKEQLKEKDIQLQEKDKQINELINLNKNNQVLLKQQQDKEIKELEISKHFEEFDKKLIELKGKLEDKKKSSNRSIWDRIKLKSSL